MPNMPQPPTSSPFDLPTGPNPLWTRWMLQIFKRLGGSIGDTIPEVTAALADVQADVSAIDGRVSILESSGPQLASRLVSTLPAAASNTGRMYLVTNESGGAVPAFSDGTNWRRVTDRAVVS